MHAAVMAEKFPVVRLDSLALQAARLLAGNRLPGLVVITADGRPYTVLPASDVVKFLVPAYVQEAPTLAAVLSESMADRAADKLGGKTVRDVLSTRPSELAVVEHDDNIVEVAATMARLRCPLAAVLRDGTMIGVITASRLLELVLAPH
ncbi:CBS domain-containing protein [Amycolatopsis sp. NPDC057786]|uniref:CBS domain-containing protein n=1 Tax=Amycolatopsis sp. NPDC057786 TaxID=3346250 RepID=UPI00366D6ADF